MKRRSLIVVSALLLAGLPCAAQVFQNAGSQISLVPAGQTSLPAGQYVITNIGTGQALYAVVQAGGQMMVQDPRVLQISVTQAAPAPLSQGQIQPGQPGQPGNAWGGMIKQGLGNFLQNKFAPAGAAGVPGQ